MKDLSTFTNLYQLSKTLRFELIPQGKTHKNIENSDLLEQDKNRAENYVLVKKIIDDYHKVFIAQAMEGLQLTGLNEYFTYYQIQKKSEEQKTKFIEIQGKLRKEIADRFKEDKLFARIDKKELFKEDLYRLNLDEDQKKLVKDFESFTTYFTGFHENRKNMYSADEKATAIAYRLIHENLPRFIDNMRSFEKLRISPVKDKFELLLTDEELGPVVQGCMVEDMFNLDFFNETLTQRGIDQYNHLIGGFTPEEGKQKIKGLNEYINLFNQTASRGQRLPKLKPLYKQILSDRNAISWLPEEFEPGDDNKVLEAIEKCYQDLCYQVFYKEKDGEHNLVDLLLQLNDFDLNKIYIRNDTGLTDISQKLFGSWATIQKVIETRFEKENPKGARQSQESYDLQKEKNFKNADSFSIGFINDCLGEYGDIERDGKICTKNIADYFTSLGKSETDENCFAKVDQHYEIAKDLLNAPYTKDLAQDKPAVEKIKLLLDSFKAVQWFIKPLLGEGNEAEKDERFYGEFIELWKVLDQVTPLYNKVRNYMTRKPYKTKKIQLFFENKGQFLGGWVDSKTENSDNGTQAGGYLFRKRNKIGEFDYYLGISADAKLFRNNEEDVRSEYERLDYYQLKSASVYGNSYVGGSYDNDKKALNVAIERFVSQIKDDSVRNRIFNEFSKLKAENYIPSSLYNIVNEKFKEYQPQLLDFYEFKTQNERITKNLRKTILSLTRVPKSKTYKDIDFITFIDAQKAIDELCKEKVFNYFSVKDEEIKDAISRKDKPLLLFKISNKDLSFAEKNSEGKRISRGVDNLHTLYFKALMQGNQNVLDIGTGKVFFREKSLNYTDEELQKGHHYNELKSKFNYPIISNRRYAFDKFQFHLSIIQNYQQPKTLRNLDLKVNEYIKDSNDIHIIGIDRGERHLLYLTLIDASGKIVEQYSLNEIVNEHNGQTFRTNYRDLLDKREGDRDEARRNWKTIETIKELKEGYLSQVVHKIAGLMVKYKAIVVLEDLNAGFMRGRQKVEKQVYQKFEKILIDKLNYLVDKKKQFSEPGGVLNAYQFTDSYTNFMKYKKKQCGFLFYVPAWNTSKMDPVTGFVNLFDTRYENVQKAKAFFGKFKSVRYNHEKQYFEFEVDNYSAFSAKADGTQQNWVICSHGDRIVNFRNPAKNNEWDDKTVLLSDEFKSFFKAKKIEFEHGNCIKAQILQQGDADKDFYEGLLKLFKLTLQMRNSKIKSDVDFLISPVLNHNGEFYFSETEKNKGKDENGNWISKLPVDADANGAYNIARKGLWVVEQIKQASDFKKLKLAISNKEWLNFIQNQQ